MSEMPVRKSRFLLLAASAAASPPTLADDERSAPGRRERALLLLGTSLSLLICGGLLLYGSGRGFDLTDEVFYLIWARDPDAYALIYQPFGYLLHPLFSLAGGSLRAYRVSGFAITAGAGALLGISLAPDRRDRWRFCLGGAAAALTIFFPWIITPSYNSAANVGAMLIIAGLVHGWADRPLAAILAGAAGLCLAAFAKPPLCAIALVVMLLAAAARPGQTRVALIAAASLGAVLTALFLSPADLPGLLRRMSATQHLLALPNTPLGLPAKVMHDVLAVPPVLIAAFVAAITSFALRRSRWAVWPGYVAVILSLLYLASVAGDAIDGDIPDFIGLAFVLTAIGYAGARQGEWPNPLAIGLLLGAPCAVALGTFNNQWSQLNFSMCFPFIALLMLASADPVCWRRTVFYLLAIAGPALVMVVAAFDPYSLPAPIFQQQYSVEHPVTHSPVLVDSETADFVRAASNRARGALLIDLSGTGPGVGAVLGARVPILPWLNPATATWPDVVWSRLDAADRERAWFVGPVWPLFVRTAPARWLARRKARLCPTDLPEMPFWGEERRLVLWRPCAGGGHRSGSG